MKRFKRTLAYLIISIASGVVGGWYLSLQKYEEDSCKISVLFSPNGGCTDRIVYEIDSSRSKVRMQAFAFNSERIAEALVRASERGVDVRCIFDKSQIKINRKNWNLVSLLSTKVNRCVVDSPRGYAHSKIIIIDDDVVITGSFNWTNAAEYKNVENLLVIRSPHIVGLYKQAWQERFEICERKNITLESLNP